MSGWTVPGLPPPTDAPEGRGQFVIVMSREAWARQVTDALDALRAANGGTEPATLRDCAQLDRAAFGRLIEALIALGAEVDAELQHLAGIRPIECL